MSLDTIGEQVLARLEAKNARREAVLGLSRHMVQHAARAIRALHRGEWAAADGILAEAGGLLAEMHTATAGHADLASAGYTVDAQKELAEAHLLRALLTGSELPTPEALGVEDAAWLHGLGEAGGELRRAALDRLRRGEVAQAETALERMEDIYVFLTTVDFPSAITRDIRRTNDMVRGVTERTRGRQEALKAALERVEAGRMDPGRMDPGRMDPAE
jgi:translin